MTVADLLAPWEKRKRGSRRRVFRNKPMTPLALEELEARRVLDAAPVITELLASNDAGQKDEDGDRSDWIELFNPGEAPIELDRWYLTDDANDLNKWRFPNVTLAPQEYLIVYASGKDRTDPAANLHTNFRLARSGEYLALVKPDGMEVAFALTPQFPPQHADISFGLHQESVASMLIKPGDEARILVPTGEAGDAVLGTTWTKIGFDDSEWMTGSTGVGYDRGTGYESLIETGVEEAMYRKNATGYIRIPFALPETNAIYALRLRMQYDDGYVAYLNGVEVARRNAPAELAYDSSATESRSDRLAVQVEEVDISEFLSDLRVGDNVLSIHIMNSRPNDSDLLVVPELAALSPGTLNSPQARFFVTPTPGAPNGTVSFGGNIVDDVKVSSGRGFYDEPVQVVMSSGTPGATIVYTTDGSLPTLENGVRVPAPDANTPPSSTLRVAATTTLRVGAFKDDFLGSSVDTLSYFFLDDVLHQSPDGEPPPGWPDRPVNGQQFDYGMDPDVVNDPEYGPEMKDALLSIPSISLVMDADDIFDPDTGFFVNGIPSLAETRLWERPVSVELIRPDGVPGFQIDAGVRMRGGWSRLGMNPKHAFRLVFRGEYGATKLRYSLFDDEGVDEFDNLDLRTAQIPSWSLCTLGGSLLQGGCRFNTMVRDVFTRDTQRDMGQPYTRSRYYHLYLNGQYWGLFQSQERSEASYAESYFGGDKDDYDVIKVDKAPFASASSFIPREVVATDGSIEAWRQLWNESKAGFADNEAYYRVQGLHVDGSRNPEYPVLLDVDNLIDYMLTIFYTGNIDGPITKSDTTYNHTNNWYAIRDREGDEGFQFFVHDAEWTLLDIRDNRLGPYPAGETFDQSNPQWIHQQLMENAEYRLRFADRVQMHLFNGGALTPEAALPRLEARVGKIELAILAESARWGDTWRAEPFTREDWRAAVAQITERFIPRRTEFLIEQLAAAQLRDGRVAPLISELQVPEFSQHGGMIGPTFQLSILGSGDIFYTLDGSDPRDHAPLVERTSLVDESTTIRWTVPLDDMLRRDWTTVAYDDVSWAEGETAIGYDTRDGELERFIATDVETEMYGVNSTLYVRVPFKLSEPSGVDMLQLQMAYSDGFVAYLNGEEVARRNAPDDVTWVSHSEGRRNNIASEQSESVNISAHIDLLRAGTNVLAIHALSHGVTDRDFFVRPRLFVGSISETGVSQSAKKYWEPVALKENTVVKSRTLLGDQWSALTQAEFTVEQDIVAVQPGDGNRDGVFNQLDIVQVLQAAEYLTGEPATWSEGDWNGDGVFDQLDIIAAMATGNYLQGPYAAIDAAMTDQGN